MKTVETISLAGETVLVRVDFNVPLNADFQITDDSRMRAALPTLNKILSDGGSVIIMSHLGRPKTGPEDKFSLRHIQSHLAELLARPVQFAPDCIDEEAKQMAASLKSGEVLLLENLRFYKEEEKGDEAFSSALASLGSFYVNDAFGTAHRAHASTAVMAAHFPGKKAFGYLMAKEVANAQKVMDSPARPLTAIVGGAKVSDKILIVENLMKVADHILIGGGMAYTFFKAQGGEIGNSLCEEDRLDTCREILARAAESGVQIHLPVDSVLADKFAADAATQVPPGYVGLSLSIYLLLYVVLLFAYIYTLFSMARKAVTTPEYEDASIPHANPRIESTILPIQPQESQS